MRFLTPKRNSPADCRSLHLAVDPTCARHRSKKRDEARTKKVLDKADKEDDGVVELDDEGDVDMKLERGEQEYPPRPHGCFKE